MASKEQDLNFYEKKLDCNSTGVRAQQSQQLHVKFTIVFFKFVLSNACLEALT